MELPMPPRSEQSRSPRAVVRSVSPLGASTAGNITVLVVGAAFTDLGELLLDVHIHAHYRLACNAHGITVSLLLQAMSSAASAPLTCPAKCSTRAPSHVSRRPTRTRCAIGSTNLRWHAPPLGCLVPSRCWFRSMASTTAGTACDFGITTSRRCSSLRSTRREVPPAAARSST